MAVTLNASGTQAATVTTEHFLASPNVAGTFVLQLDLVNMVAGDVVELRVYKMVLAGGTARVVSFAQFAGPQPTDSLIAISEGIANTLTDATAVRFSLKQTFGTSRNFPWAVYNVEDFTTVPQVDVTKWNGTAVSAPATAGIPEVNVKAINNVSAAAVTTVKAVQGLTTADTITTYTGNTLQTGDAFARLGAPAGASTAVDIAAVKTDSAAIKVVTDQLVAAQAEPAGAPTANPSPLVKIARLHQALRNQLIVNSNTLKLEFYDDSGVLLWSKALTDIAGVYTEAEGA
jgi:hypothetical protein